MSPLLLLVEEPVKARLELLKAGGGRGGQGLRQCAQCNRVHNPVSRLRRRSRVNKQPVFQASQAHEHFPAAAGAKLGRSTRGALMLWGVWGREIATTKEEKIVKIRQWKQSHLTTPSERDFTAHQEALLSAVILDKRNIARDA